MRVRSSCSVARSPRCARRIERRMKAPKSSQELFERALALQQSGKAKEAEPLYRKVISRNAEHARALFGLSVILLEAGQLEESRRYLERAVTAEPDEPKYLTNLGEIYRREGRLELAARAFERVIAGNPDAVEARQLFGLWMIADHDGDIAGKFARLVTVEEVGEAVQMLGDEDRDARALRHLLEAPTELQFAG